MGFNTIFERRRKNKIEFKMLSFTCCSSSQTNPRPKKVAFRDSNLLGLTKTLTCCNLPISKTFKPGVWCFWMRTGWGRASSRNVRRGSIPALSFSSLPFLLLVGVESESNFSHSVEKPVLTFILSFLHSKTSWKAGYHWLEPYTFHRVIWIVQWTTQPLLKGLRLGSREVTVLFFYEQGNWEFHEFT